MRTIILAKTLSLCTVSFAQSATMSTMSERCPINHKHNEPSPKASACDLSSYTTENDKCCVLIARRRLATAQPAVSLYVGGCVGVEMLAHVHHETALRIVRTVLGNKTNTLQHKSPNVFVIGQSTFCSINDRTTHTLPLCSHIPCRCEWA